MQVLAELGLAPHPSVTRLDCAILKYICQVKSIIKLQLPIES